MKNIIHSHTKLIKKLSAIEKQKHKHIMKKVSIYVMALAILLFASCDNGKNEIARLNAQLDSISEVNSSQQEKMDHLSSMMDVVTESLDSIAEQEEMLLSSTNGSEGKISKRELKKRLNEFANLLQRQKERIASLESSLSSNSIEVSKLKKVIDFLNAQIDEKEKAIASMTAELDQKNTNIRELTEKVQHLDAANAELNTIIKEQASTLKSNDESMHTCYYKIGTKKALKEAGLLTKSNLFTKSKLNVTSIDYKNCSKIDMRNVEEILIPSKKPKVLTHMPSGSYQIVTSGDNSILKITDPNTFWSVSNVLIIQTN